jgi:glyceraldehyde-3-phosphate dehydrogenase (NAD(P))
MIKVAINGYGTIGKRVADAVAAQKDMKVIGVSKTRPNAEAFVAKQRGYPLYIADLSKKAAFEKAGLIVHGSVEDMCKAADVIVDATPGDVGATNKPLYEKLGKKAKIMRSPGSPLTRHAITRMQLAGSLYEWFPVTQPACAVSFMK